MDYELRPIKLHMEACATLEEMNSNVEATLARGYDPINAYLGAFKGEVSICGSGPSLEKCLGELTGDIIAVNSAISFLVDHGVIPRFAMLWDASPLVAKFVVPNEHITYLVGARCHPSVFERLDGCRTIVWYAGGDHNITELMRQREIKEPVINGGSAGVTRGIFLAMALGYMDIHLFGADSSYSDDGRTHVRGSLVPEKDFTIQMAGKNYRSTPEMVAQADEFRNIMRGYAQWAKFTAHGEGLLPDMWKLMTNPNISCTWEPTT